MKHVICEVWSAASPKLGLFVLWRLSVKENVAGDEGWCYTKLNSNCNHHDSQNYLNHKKNFLWWSMTLKYLHQKKWNKKELNKHPPSPVWPKLVLINFNEDQTKIKSYLTSTLCNWEHRDNPVMWIEGDDLHLNEGILTIFFQMFTREFSDGQPVRYVR